VRVGEECGKKCERRKLGKTKRSGAADASRADHRSIYTL
jgi:hypothetical protein